MTDKHHLHTLILPETIRWLKKRAQKAGLSVGQVIDRIVQQLKARKGKNG